MWEVVMKSTTKIIISLVAVAVIAAGALLLMGGKSDNEGESDSPAAGQESVEITYDETGFSPADATIISGGKVTIVNETDEEIKPSSDPHPDHTDNPELNFGDIPAGQRKTITVTTPGTWGYHNHYHEDDSGSLVVR
jgi:plastocyanin